MSNPTDFFGDCQEFANLYLEKTQQKATGKINREFIIKMVMDELDELKEAKDETEEVDALLDATYYIFDHLAKTGLDIRPVWKLIHEANMTKFGPGGHRREDGKWCKPPNFTPPDDKIREEITRQRQEQL
jgi:predicted HAD superfamily Cof-like phosphohydrolase